MDSRILSKSFGKILLIIFLFSFIVFRLDQRFIRIGFIVEFGIASIIHIYLFKNLYKNAIYTKFVIIVLFFGIIQFFNMIIVHNLSLKHLLFTIWIMTAISMLIFFVKTDVFEQHIIILFIILLICSRWMILKNPEYITVNSRNYVVFFIFLYSLPYYYNCKLDNKIPLIIYPVICLILSILAIGRGSIIMSFILLFGWILEYIKNSKHKLLFSFFIIIISCILLSYIINIRLYERTFSRFGQKGFHSVLRLEGWTAYFNSLSNTKNILLGTNLSSIPFISEYLNCSLHNSYLTLHAQMGIFGFFYFFVLVKGVIILIKGKNIFFIFYYIAFFVKAFIDTDFPATLVGGDMYIYLLILLFLSYSNRKKDNYLLKYNENLMI